MPKVIMYAPQSSHFVQEFCQRWAHMPQWAQPAIQAKMSAAIAVDKLDLPYVHRERLIGLLDYYTEAMLLDMKTSFQALVIAVIGAVVFWPLTARVLDLAIERFRLPAPFIAPFTVVVALVAITVLYRIAHELLSLSPSYQAKEEKIRRTHWAMMISSYRDHPTLLEKDLGHLAQFDEYLRRQYRHIRRLTVRV